MLSKAYWPGTDERGRKITQVQAGQRRTIEISNRRRVVAEMYLRGVLQANIAIELGVNQSTISRDLKALQKEWLNSALVNIDEAKGKELAKIDNLEREYWDAWKRSQENAETRTTTTGPAGTATEVFKEEGQTGDPRYLEGVYRCINKRCEILGLDASKRVGLSLENMEGIVPGSLVLSADLIASSFLDVFRDVKDRRHMEYLLKGGRGSTKSSFTSLAIIYLLVNNPGVHALAMRQVANTLRDSVYAQLVWAIGMMGLENQFKCTTNPLEITYIPTGQKIFFRGGDNPEKIKSIKAPFGHIGILWFEELDQFHGPEAIRKIEQSVLRGGEEAWDFKTYNPPRSAANWVNKYAQIPKTNQYQHHSTYLDVPPDWLGQTFIDEAEHLKAVNPKAYEHEYLGIANGTGGLIFENIQIRKITDEEIAQFDRIYFGLDWGYALDPLHWVKLHYDAAREIIYIYDEFRAHKMDNRELYETLVVKKGMTSEDWIIADSAEPKSIGDFLKYATEPIQIVDEEGNPVLGNDKPVEIFGPSCRGAEKGPDSVRYSMRWLQNRTQIVIDQECVPFATQEFLDYEYETTKDGEFISQYPDKNNHAIDAVRYALNLVWRRRGE